MDVECIDAEGFEDQLTRKSYYRVEGRGMNSYLIKNDKQEFVWYGNVKFIPDIYDIRLPS